MIAGVKHDARTCENCGKTVPHFVHGNGGIGGPRELDCSACGHLTMEMPDGTIIPKEQYLKQELARLTAA